MPKTPRRVFLVALLSAVVMLAGCASEPASPSGAGAKDAGAAPMTADVMMRDIKYDSADVTVAVGGTVTWINHDAMGHTVTPTDTAQWGSEGSGNAPEAWLPLDGTWQFTFTKPGVYKYYCLPHASRGSDGEYKGMVGTVRVVGAGAPSTPSPTTPTEAAPYEGTATVVRDPVAPARTLPDADGIVRLTLETREVTAQLADGVGYTFWTFDGTVPGPMLRVREGDTVELTVKNAPDSTHPHSIDLHSVTGPGGGARVTQVNPGDSATFRFKALNPGVYVYHCASPHIPTHVANGMYGMILVEPAEGLPAVDREYYVVQGEFYTEGKVGEKGLQAFSHEKMLDERAEYYLMNGRVGALTGDNALKANVGETVRIYFGVGGFVPSSFHVIGEIFDHVYPEGGTPVVDDVQTTLVPAGGATMVEFRVEYPGTYLLVDHWLTHAIDRGAVGLLVVEGEADPAVFEGRETAGSGH